MDFSLPGLKDAPGNPLLFIILDGVGLYRGQADGYPGNALDLADAPTLKGLIKDAPISTQIAAHGTAVGLPSDDDMGNSEVGHNAMGAGRIFDQGAKLVGNAIASRSLFQGRVWRKLIGTATDPGHALQGDGKPVHLLGLLSDGNVHSHIDHLFALLDECAAVGVARVYVHILLDGRDVAGQSAHLYIEQLEEKLRSLSPDYKIASGGGRMMITMDRYEADWGMIERGWQTHVAGTEAGFASAAAALEHHRKDRPELIDQDVPPFVIHDLDGQPVGPIRNDDVVILFNFRGDRAIEISRAFAEADLATFKREPAVNVHYAGIMEYDGDLSIPPDYLVEPPAIDRCVSEYLARNEIAQYAISETQKFGHVTYFWNGNNSKKFSESAEEWVEIPSDVISFDEAPAMKAVEITDATIQAIESGSYRLLRVNFANGDMVGHTGNLEAAVKSVEATDAALARLLVSAEKAGLTVVVTADHGNCDQMIELDKAGQAKQDADGNYIPKTSHTLSPVPFIVTGKDADRFAVDPSVSKGGLGNIAASILVLMGYQPPQDYLPALIRLRD